METPKSYVESFLNSVFFLNANLGWAVGGEGTVIRTLDGGENWRPRKGAKATIT